VPIAVPTPYASYPVHEVKPYMAERYRMVLGVRNRAPQRAAVDVLRPLFDASPAAILLEAVRVTGGYRCMLLAVEAESVVLVTNLQLDERPGTPFAGGPGTLRKYMSNDAAMAARTRSRIEQLRFDTGAGGDADTRDGSVHFIWVRVLGEDRHAALYGYSYPATEAVWKRPEAGTDGPRWDAIVAAYEIWRDVTGAAGAPIEVLMDAAR
jgi:hypothetical protein